MPTITILIFIFDCLVRIFLDHFIEDSSYGSNEVVFIIVLTMANLDGDLSRMSIGEFDESGTALYRSKLNVPMRGGHMRFKPF